MADCVFCKIIAGEIPAAKLLEDERTISFLDISPVNRGHALVVPKRHVAGLLDLADEEICAAMLMVRRVAAAVKAATGCPAFNVLQNDGEAAGQLVPHAHFHVIPRSPDDGFKPGWRQLKYAEGELELLQAAIRRHL